MNPCGVTSSATTSISGTMASSGGTSFSVRAGSMPLSSSAGFAGVSLDGLVVGLHRSLVDLLGLLHRCLDAVLHGGDADHEQTGLAGVELLTELLEVVA